MKKMFLVTLVVTTVFGFSTLASAEADHWATADQCVAATAAPYYYPTIVKEQPLTKSEVARGFPTPSCVDMQLPDRLGGRGWVRIGEDRKIIFDRNTGRALRLAECNNQIYAVVALPAVQAMDGRDGEPGPPGPKGDPGLSGRDGRDGRDGKDGEDGYSPVKNVDYRDGKDGKDGNVPGPPGPLGLQGPRGYDGRDGAPAPLSWGQEHPWLKAGLIVGAVVAGILICRNNCANWLGLEAAAPAAVAPIGVGPGSVISPTF